MRAHGVVLPEPSSDDRFRLIDSGEPLGVENLASHRHPNVSHIEPIASAVRLWRWSLLGASSS